MAQNSAAAPAVRSSLERDYEYDIDNDVFLFYPSPPAFESSRDDLFPSVRSGVSQGFLWATPTTPLVPHWLL